MHAFDRRKKNIRRVKRFYLLIVKKKDIIIASNVTRNTDVLIHFYFIIYNSELLR